MTAASAAAGAEGAAPRPGERGDPRPRSNRARPGRRSVARPRSPYPRSGVAGAGSDRSAAGRPGTTRVEAGAAAAGSIGLPPSSSLVERRSPESRIASFRSSRSSSRIRSRSPTWRGCPADAERICSQMRSRSAVASAIDASARSRSRGPARPRESSACAVISSACGGPRSRSRPRAGGRSPGSERPGLEQIADSERSWGPAGFASASPASEPLPRPRGLRGVGPELEGFTVGSG